ncbi:DUF3300 domain-containing protein [Kaistia dalseonensis]|uniref:DUF3300 domain-containing protein n=1 Tax=Kaistia dalseonensis TaxID=410840 RepID=UPI0022508FD8|nr:DUF3300 domain-containing protein [Kaistia dalseonensis]
MALFLLAATSLTTMSSIGRAAETPPPPAAQTAPAVPTAPPVDAAPADQAAAAAPAADLFTQAELRKLLAPFALYPDALLAQLLPACAYPVDIVQAARWIDKNKAAVAKGDFSSADTQNWDPSVKALVRFPDIIAKLNDDLDLTTDLGDAFVNQPEDVASMIQDLRREAQKAGSLKTTKQQKVSVQDQGGTNYVVIEPADPGVIYVPVYDPATVYYDSGDALAAGVIGFGVGVAVGAIVNNPWDWNRGWVYPPRWAGYPGYRPGYGGGNVNIGNEINIGSGNTRPWRPDNDRYRPGQGSKPALANRPSGSRTSNAARPGAAGRPDGSVPRIGGGEGGAKLGAAGAGAKVGGGEARARAEAGAGNRQATSGKVTTKKQAAAPKKQAAAAKKSAAPAKRPAAQQRPARDTAFSGADYGGRASGAMSNRGAASRQSISRPQGGNRPAVNRGGGGRQMGGGGGGGRRR